MQSNIINPIPWVPSSTRYIHRSCSFLPAGCMTPTETDFCGLYRLLETSHILLHHLLHIKLDLHPHSISLDHLSNTILLHQFILSVLLLLYQERSLIRCFPILLQLTQHPGLCHQTIKALFRGQA